MCFYLTVAVPQEHAGRLRDVFGRGFQVRPTTNPSVLSALPSGYAPHVITVGMCSCELYARPHNGKTADPADHLRRKYERRGWNAAKIARAVQQAQASEVVPPASGLRLDVAERLQTLCRSVGSVALVVHWCDGDVETDRISLRRAEFCDCSELLTRAEHLSEDQVLLAATRRAD